jgi:hypothetical protein
LIDYQNLEIEMRPVVPGNYVRAFLGDFLEYASTHDGSLSHIPIGFNTEDESLIVVDNSRGRIQLEDHENSTFQEIANNLYDLLNDAN